ELDAFSKNSLVADNSTGNYSRLWRSFYQNIYQTNIILEGLSNSTAITDSLRDQLRGEMLLVRAMNYFYLVNLYGDVPLELTSDFTINSIMPRTAVAQVYQKITADLVEAKTLLKAIYPSTNRARPNKWTAG